MRKFWFVVMILMVTAALLLAGCGGSNDNEVSTVAPSPNPALATPLPATWTPGAPADANTTPAGGQPLPPTWTPYVRPSVTPLPTVKINPTMTAENNLSLPTAVPPGATWTPLPDTCYQLEALDAPDSVRIGQSVQISWQPVPGVTQYQVQLRHPGGGVLLQQAVTGTTFEFIADWFTAVGVYGWQVMPLNNTGQPICFPISGEIVASTR